MFRVGTAKPGASRGRASRSGQTRTVSCWGLLAAGNIGNDASFEVFAGWLNGKCPGVELRIVSTSPFAAGRRYGLPSRPFMTSSGPSDGPFRLPRRISARLSDIVRAYIVLPRATDALVVPGMGVLEDSMFVSPLGVPLLLALMAAGCRRAGTPFLLVDIGAEFATNRLTRVLFASCVRQASHVSVRDELSGQVVRHADPHRVALRAPDLVFAHPAEPNCAPIPGRVVVGVISAERSLGERGRGYTSRMARLVLELTRHNLEVVLVGGDSDDDDTANAISDEAAALDPSLPRAQLSLVDNYADLLDVFASAEVAIASRYHNLVAAVRAGRPVLSLGYAEKCTQLLAGVGLDEYCHHIEDFEPDSVSRVLVGMLASSDDLALRVQSRSSAYAAEVEGLLFRVARDMGLTMTPGQSSSGLRTECVRPDESQRTGSP